MNDAQKYIEKLCDEYIIPHLHEQERDKLIEENNIEQRDIKGYHGREILELLQNADDAYQKALDDGHKQDSELTVLIRYAENQLTISNTGTYFDNEGIKAIVQGNNSSKEKGKYIGNKGTGFRSVLNWAEEIRIHSGKFNILFSKEIAKNKFNEISSKQQIRKQLEKKPNLYIPMLSLPHNIESIENEFDTTIQIKIKENLKENNFGVLEQINNIDIKLLLFLPNISKITIELENETIVYEREIIPTEFKEIILRKIVSGEQLTNEIYYVFEKVIEKEIEEDDEKKDILLAVAVPKNYNTFKNTCLYSFFPLKDTVSPFNCILHASYELQDNRNGLTQSEINRQIIQHQIQFLIEVALKFTKAEYPGFALRLLTPTGFFDKNWNFSVPFLHFNLKNFYFNLLQNTKVLRTVNNDYISIADSPKLFDSLIPSIFIGESFASLLAPIEQELIDIGSKKLIHEVARFANTDLKFDEDRLLSIINQETLKWTVEQQVEVFIWWNITYKSSLPNLLKTQDNKWISLNDECYFLVGDSICNLPTWVKVPSLAKEYQEAVFMQASNDEAIKKIKQSDSSHISRVISQHNIYELVKFNYRDKNSIILTVNSSVDSYEKSVEFVKWLWETYGDDIDWNPPKGTEAHSRTYKFPNSTQQSICDSEKLYFGKYYGNNLASKLFNRLFGEFPPSYLFSITKDNITRFVEFIQKFGVVFFPKIEMQAIDPDKLYKQPIEDKILKSQAMIGSSWYLREINYQLPFITDLQLILENLTTEEIILWVKKDHKLYSCLANPHCTDNTLITFIGNSQRSARCYHGTIKNYILFLFRKHKWVRINSIKYAPIEILNGIHLKNNLAFEELVPVITSEYIKKISQLVDLKYNEIEEIFNLFSLPENPTELDSDDFYELMLKIQNYKFDESTKLSKSIYRIIEKPNFSKEFVNTEIRSKFFLEGKLLVRLHGKLQYYKASESFLPSSKIVVKYNVPIVEKGLRTNNTGFSKIFNCKEYTSEYEIINSSIHVSDQNSYFQNYYKEFIKFALPFGKDNSNIAKYLPHAKITLVDAISLYENGRTVDVSEEYITLRKSSTQWYITVFATQLDINRLSIEIENICSNIANTRGFDEGKIGEIFRTESKQNREFLIKKEFGSIDVIDDIYYNNNIRNNFLEAIKQIAPTYNVDTLDLDFCDFESIDNHKKIISILQAVNTDIEQFTASGFVYSIDLIPYFKILLDKFIRKEVDNYTNYIFTIAQENLQMQDKFLKLKDEFANFEISEYKNSIYFDIESIMQERFGVWSNLEVKDAKSTYNENYQTLNPDNLFVDEIKKNTQIQTMIYFNKKDEFKLWIRNKEKFYQENNKLENYDMYEALRLTIPSKQEPTYNTNKLIKQNSRKRFSGGSYIESEDEKNRRAKKICGNKGELIIYNLLCEKHGKENVYPKSEAYVELGILKPGQASADGYDISYKNTVGDEFFVEVKTGSKHSFFITPNELAFAEKYPEKYKLFLVYDIDSGNPQYSELPKRFWKDERFKLEKIIERISVEF